jgi:hypothetical protein
LGLSFILGPCGRIRVQLSFCYGAAVARAANP